jgi:hypothetical protein
MNLYLHHLLHLTTSFLLSSMDTRHFLLSKWRQLMAMFMAMPIFWLPIWLWGEIDPSYQYSMSLVITWSSILCGIIWFAFYILSCKSLEMMGSDKIHTASCTYIHVLSLCHLYPLLVTWRITNENIQMIIFSCNSSHNFIPKRKLAVELSSHNLLHGSSQA